MERYFILHHGMISIVNGEHKASFVRAEDFERCSGISLAGKDKINYEPDNKFFTDNVDLSVGPHLIPYLPYEKIIDMAAELAERAEDIFYNRKPNEIADLNRALAIQLQSAVVFDLLHDQERQKLGVVAYLNSEQRERGKQILELTNQVILNPPDAPVELPEWTGSDLIAFLNKILM